MVIKFTTILPRKKKYKQFLDGTLQMLIKIEFSQLPGHKTKVNDNLYENNLKNDKEKDGKKERCIYVFILCAN